jgi:hypothetical protein
MLSGQDGYSRDLLSYGSTSNVIMAGVNLHPSKRLDLGANLVLTSSKAELDPFSLAVPDFVARVPTMIYDFSQTPGYSKLDTSRVDGELNAAYHVSDAFRVFGSWRYVDFTDDSPYLYDTTGSVQILTMAMGWTF